MLLALTLPLLSWFSGCGGDELPRGAVRGKVTIGDAPLPRGRILFLPQAPTEGPTVAATIDNGLYELRESEGPVVGMNRVEVDMPREVGIAIDDERAFAQRGGAAVPVNAIPPQFNTQSTLSTNINPGENVYDVTIPVAPMR